VTKEMLIGEALKQGNASKIAEVLQNYGMHCLGCAIASQETIEQAAAVHGVGVNEMVAKLNEAAKA